MKIICVDNYDREGPGHDDKLIATTVPESTGKIIVNLLNKQTDPLGEGYYRLVEDDHELRRFEP